MIICYGCGKTVMVNNGEGPTPMGWRVKTIVVTIGESKTSETRNACSDACADKAYDGWA